MKPEDYPAQEPFSEMGARQHAKVMALVDGIAATDVMVGSDPYQSVAVYRANQPRGNVLCVMHGGGWTNGYKEWMAYMAPAVTSRGITMVSIGYRLAPRHIHPAGMNDCMDAVAWVYRNIADYGGDPNRIFISGHSAGGHFAAMLALLTDWQAPRSLSANVIRGALPISGTFLFGPESGFSMRPRFLGDEALGNEALASPMNHLRAEAPPFMVAWGEKDFPHLVRQSERFAHDSSALGNAVETIVLAQCDHLGAGFAAGDVDGAWIEAADKFMNKH
ncbi:MAG: alpha/beta hydrolase [Burkholderiaceae bacterium]